MANDVTQRIKPIIVLEALKKHTDRDHYLTITELRNILEKEYDITMGKTTFTETIDSLMTDLPSDFGSIELDDSGIKKYALFNKNALNKSEIRYIADALYSSRSLSYYKSACLLNKISRYIPKFNMVDYNAHINNEALPSIGDVFNKIDVIHQAINKGRKITFKFSTFNEDGKIEKRKEDTVYEVSPYRTANNNGFYYLIGAKYGANKIRTYRMDNIYDLTISKDKSIPIEEMIDYKEYLDEKGDFSFKKYCERHIYFADGRVIRATLRIHQKRYIGAIKDWFGPNTTIYHDGNMYKVDVFCDENALFFWCMQYSEQVTVLAPEQLKNKIRETAKALAARYSDEKKKSISLDAMFTKYFNLYLDTNFQLFKWQGLELDDLFYEIRKADPNKPVDLLDMQLEARPITKRDGSILNYYVLKDGRARIISLLLYIDYLLKLLLDNDPNNKEYLSVYNRYNNTKVETISDSRYLKVNIKNLLESDELLGVRQEITDKLNRYFNSLKLQNRIEEAEKLLRVINKQIHLSIIQ